MSIASQCCLLQCKDYCCEHVLVFPWDQRGLLFLDLPNLLVGDVYHIKNEVCVLEVFIMRLFNQTLSIHARPEIPVSLPVGIGGVPVSGTMPNH